MDIEACLEYLLPDPKYKGTAHFTDQVDYDSREWVDARSKPTWADLQAVWPRVEAAQQPPASVPSNAELAARIKKLEDAQI